MNERKGPDLTLVGLQGDREDSDENMETNVSAIGESGGAPTVLSLRGVSKRYGPVHANNNVSLDVLAGEIHAVLGENGSGKSTLLGIASGTVVPDDGVVEIAGEPLTTASAKAAMELGLGMAYQTMTEVIGLSVAENLFLAAPPSERPKYGRMEPWAAERLREAELDIAASAPTASLSLAQRQMLEVVQALLSKPKVLLLDEPTTALGHGDVERLHALIRNLAAQGIGIAYVSHRLPEVLSVAHRVTVLRDGVGQGTFDAAKVSEADVVALMIGRPLEMVFPASAGNASDEVLLQVSQAPRPPVRARRSDASPAARSSASRAPRATARSSSCGPWPGSSRRTVRSRAAASRSICAVPPDRCVRGSCC